jgi:hypothetical protein
MQPLPGIAMAADAAFVRTLRALVGSEASPRSAARRGARVVGGTRFKDLLILGQRHGIGSRSSNASSFILLVCVFEFSEEFCEVGQKKMQEDGGLCFLVNQYTSKQTTHNYVPITRWSLKDITPPRV